MARCKAKAKTTGERCKKDAVPGYKVCHIHGGKSPRGLASATFKHGRYSRDLPEQLRAKYDQIETDAQLLDLHQDIRLVDAIIRTNLETLDTGENAAAWSQMRGLLGELQVAHKKDDAPAFASCMILMHNLVDRRLNHFLAQEEIIKQVDARRKLVSEENRKQLAGERAVSVQELMTFMAAVMRVISDVVTDKSQRIKINRGIDELFNQPPKRLAQ